MRLGGQQHCTIYGAPKTTNYLCRHVHIRDAQLTVSMWAQYAYWNEAGPKIHNEKHKFDFLVRRSIISKTQYFWMRRVHLD